MELQKRSKPAITLVPNTEKGAPFHFSSRFSPLTSDLNVAGSVILDLPCFEDKAAEPFTYQFRVVA